mmetsp:Transcript_21917/g.44262  ORF Transcript_21917/g.44262 Transcript_21917/m.44262 type:complete len:80 (+) Transcript_21917:226-465(+)
MLQGSSSPSFAPSHLLSPCSQGIFTAEAYGTLTSAAPIPGDAPHPTHLTRRSQASFSLMPMLKLVVHRSITIDDSCPSH